MCAIKYLKQHLTFLITVLFLHSAKIQALILDAAISKALENHGMVKCTVLNPEYLISLFYKLERFFITQLCVRF